MKWLSELFNGGTDVLTIEQKQQNVKETVEKIHHEFATAGDKLLQDSLDILEEESKKDVAKGQALEAIGFKVARQVKEARESIAISSEAKGQAEMIKELQRKYPNWKFITKQNVHVINKKYNLVLGSIEQYIGFVPSKNLADIKSFFSYYDGYRQPFKNTLRRITNVLYFNSSSEKASKALEIYLNKDANNVIVDYDDYSSRALYQSMFLGVKINGFSTESCPSLLICAPAVDMGTKSVTTSSVYPDPVVLYPINDKGFLIVTAWGDEASDELVVNQDLN